MLVISSLGDHAVRVAQAGDVRIEEIRVGAHGNGLEAARGRTSLPQLVFVLEGGIHMRHGGKPLHMEASSWSLVDPNQCALAAASGTHAIVVTLPELRQALVSGTVHAGSGGVARVFRDLAGSTLEVAADLSEPARAEIGNSLTELARLVLHDDAGHQPRASARTIMCERIKTFVRRHLRESNLSIDHIARTFHCSKRYLHKVFGGNACSLNQFIWDLRLERCSRDLANTEFGDRSVTEIAFSWGFSSSSHFSRAFRQRFGVPPSAYRTALLAGSGGHALAGGMRSHVAA